MLNDESIHWLYRTNKYTVITSENEDTQTEWYNINSLIKTTKFRNNTKILQEKEIK
jgi:hypothetical protein